MPSATEQELGQLWQEVLGTPPSTPEANFFLDGGNSVAAMKLMGRVRRRWGNRVELRELLDHPSLGALAARIATLTDEINETAEVSGNGG